MDFWIWFRNGRGKYFITGEGKRRLETVVAAEEGDEMRKERGGWRGWWPKLEYKMLNPLGFCSFPTSHFRFHHLSLDVTTQQNCDSLMFYFLSIYTCVGFR
ncbi:hypothetical protein L6452_18952 [Arctium lappa]|uniref:Uncharacterized protein n=1 Tax=Arctium lappa TaxID=4217 RepID=A0ACB9B797_ARCLA|nr:hypothetical protein L6452_18952 [Arctium lappa]